MIGKNGVSLLIGHNGVQDKTTLNPANETVARGIYDATTLSVVDTDLATANIKNGITLFGFAGSANVFDISDATAVEAEVLDPETFYAVGGGIRTGTMPTVALAPGSSAYPAGYHAGEAGGLVDVDADLVTANIKSGITIFNVAGHADVRNVSDANALVGEVKTGSTFYAVGGAKKTGSGTKTLSDANDTVAAGYYAATTLHDVDAQLAAANIKSGVNIFGFVGAVTVQDIADADAVLADVKNGKTFYSVTGGRKTGNLATVALDPANSNYPAGYHAGEAGGLVDVDADLVTGSIKFGVTIFGVAGHTNVRDSSDANLTAPEAPTGKTFYAGGGARKTGSGTKTLNPANENVAAGYYAATTLSAVDGDLAAANIKSGVTIFGFTGPATVQEIGAANAILSDVKNGKTFFSVTGGIKTGNLATVAITDVNDDYPAGYHAGNVGGLVAIDAQLVTGSIKSGVTIFGVAGAATVQDIADANAGVGDVKDTVTFYSVTGARKTGTMPTVALAAGSSAYPAGYHAGEVGGLVDVDADLVTANIKNGITIFNVAGHADVRNISDADLVEGEAPTGKFFYAVSGGRRTGTGTKTLSDANETVAAGYYAATTLSTVDAHLAAANILSGVTIFGFTGPATVQDIADADAVLADVKNGKTFYSVTGGRKTGNLATVALSPDNANYPAGYHAGEAGGLVDVDAQLVTANIKSGITIFGIAGHNDVRDVSDADALVGEVKTGSTFYAVGGARKTGTGTQTLNPANENVPAGYYAATTLSAVDAQLAAANIKKDVNIFGFVGTHEGILDGASEATLAMFQTYRAIGTLFSPQYINDNNITNVTFESGVNQYVEVPFGDLVIIKRWRQRGYNQNVGDGRWKITYWNVLTDTWVDWVTGIPFYNIEAWTGFATETEVVTTKIRLVCTTEDTSADNGMRELEVIF